MKKILFILLFLLAPLVAEAVSIPLTVTEPSGQVRTSEPVTSGVPLKLSDNILSINNLRLLDSNSATVPCQFTIMSRWAGAITDTSKPIKWVLLDFQASITSNGTNTYTLVSVESGGGNVTGTNLGYTQDSNKITVTTGGAKFEISKNYFNLFDKVWIGAPSYGTQVVNQAGTGGGVLTDGDGTSQYFTNLEVPESITVEEEGPLRMVIKIRGVFKKSDAYYSPSVTAPPGFPHFDQVTGMYPHSFVYYNARIHFYNDKPYCKVAFTLEQNGSLGMVAGGDSVWAPRQYLMFHSLNLVLNMEGSITSVSSQDGTTALSSGDIYTIWQSWHVNGNPPTDTAGALPHVLVESFSSGIYYEVKKGATTLYSGLTNPGWIQTDNVGIGIKWFWQNFHKKLTVTKDSNQITIGLWPEGGYYPFDLARYNAQYYYLVGGRHKTHDILFNFDTSGTSALRKSMEQPLMALATGTYYAGADIGFGPIAPQSGIGGAFTNSDSTIAESFTRFENQQKAMVLPGSSSNGITFLNIQNVTGYYENIAAIWRYFSWMNFGDFLWGGAYGEGHYELPYSILLHYIRTGVREFFDLGSQMSVQRYDIGQYHGDRIDSSSSHSHLWHNNWQRFQEGDLHSYYPECGPDTNTCGESDEVAKPYYTWAKGPILYYLLTGDRKSLDTVLETAQGILNYYGTGTHLGQPVGLYTSIISSQNCTSDILTAFLRPAVIAVATYRLTGDSTYLTIATNIVKNVYLYREQQVGGLGILSYSSTGGTLDSYVLNCSPVACPGQFTCTAAGCTTCSNVEYIRNDDYEVLLDVNSEIHDGDLNALIIRTAGFIKDYLLTGGATNGSNYYPLSYTPFWVAQDPDGSIRGKYKTTGYNAVLADVLAYAYKLTGDTTYLAKARQLFKDLFFYGSIYAQTYATTVNTSYRYSQSFTTSPTPSIGLLGDYGQVYLNMEWNPELSIGATYNDSISIGVNGGYSHHLRGAGMGVR